MEANIQAELLDAAQDALTQMEQMRKLFEDDQEFMAALVNLREAVAKAQG